MQHQRVQREVAGRVMETPILYWHPSLPERWIAWSSEGLWVSFPTTPSGWEQRIPYRLPIAALQPADRAFETGSLSITGARRVSIHGDGPDPLQGEAYAAVNPDMPLVLAD